MPFGLLGAILVAIATLAVQVPRSVAVPLANGAKNVNPSIPQTSLDLVTNISWPLEDSLTLPPQSTTTPSPWTFPANPNSFLQNLLAPFIARNGKIALHSESSNRHNHISSIPDPPGSYGQPCNTQRPCRANAHLQCMDAMCTCSNPSRRVLHEPTGHCVGLVGTNCALISNFLVPAVECVANARCFFGKCNCDTGFSETEERTCAKSFNELCSPHECNKAKGLGCTHEGRCACRDSNFIFNSLKGTCLDPEQVVRKGATFVTNNFFSFIMSALGSILTWPARLVPFFG